LPVIARTGQAITVIAENEQYETNPCEWSPRSLAVTAVRTLEHLDDGGRPAV
jgi:hypothetical protein